MMDGSWAHYLISLAASLAALIWHARTLRTIRQCPVITAHSVKRLSAAPHLGVCLLAQSLTWPDWNLWVQHGGVTICLLSYVHAGLKSRHDPESLWAALHKRLLLIAISVGIAIAFIGTPMPHGYGGAIFAFMILMRAQSQLLDHLRRVLDDLAPLREKIQSLNAQLHAQTILSAPSSPEAPHSMQAV